MMLISIHANQNSHHEGCALVITPRGETTPSGVWHQQYTHTIMFDPLKSTGNAAKPWILVQMHMASERYQQNSQKWQTWPLLTVGLPVTSEKYWASFQVTRLFHNALFHSAIFFFCYICIFFFFWGGGGERGLALIWSGEMYWMTFSWLWPKVMAVTWISQNLLVCTIKWKPLIRSLQNVVMLLP